MAENKSEREQRLLRRDEVRERQDQEAERKKEKARQELERKERESMALQEQQRKTTYTQGYATEQRDTIDTKLPDGDNRSLISDAGTIDEYLHESTRRSIRELEERAALEEKEGKKIGYEEEDLESQTPIKHTRYGDAPDKQTSRKYSVGDYTQGLDRLTEKEQEVDTTWDPRLGCVTRKAHSSVTYLNTQSLRPPNVESRSEHIQHGRNIDLEIEKIRNEQEEIKSQHSYCETRSQKLKQFSLEEEKRKLLMLQNERRLMIEIEKKRRVENELKESILYMEKQEQELNRRRVENEKMERELIQRRKQDEDMAKRLNLLREKEELLFERSALKERENLMQVKNESSYEDIGNVTEMMALPSTRPYRARESQYDKLPDRFKATDSKYEREPPDIARYSIGEKEDSKDRAASKVKETPDNQFPLFKMGIPKVPNFNGKQFEQWKMEVNCLLRAKMYPDYAIAQAVRNSLKDETRQILLTLKPTSTTSDILNKVEEVYGNVKSGDNIVHDFYAAKQKEKESVSAWGIRLETLFQQAVDRGEIEEKKRDRKLKERFWRGILSEKLKIATRVSYESDDSFEKLRMKARREEEEEEVGRKPDGTGQNPANVSQQVNKDEKDKTLKELLERMKSIETELENLRRRNDDHSYGNRWQSRGTFRGRSRGYRRRPQYDSQKEQTRQEQQPDQTHSTEKKNEKKNSLN